MAVLMTNSYTSPAHSQPMRIQVNPKPVVWEFVYQVDCLARSAFLNSLHCCNSMFAHTTPDYHKHSSSNNVNHILCESVNLAGFTTHMHNRYKQYGADTEECCGTAR